VKVNNYKIVKYPTQDEKGRTVTPMIITCACGNLLHLDDSFANECDSCQLEYNMQGQMLAPRSQWGEETGESF